jgi:hypothetical protein
MDTHKKGELKPRVGDNSSPIKTGVFEVWKNGQLQACNIQVPEHLGEV